MKSNFKLTPSLKHFLKIGANSKYIQIGIMYPVSIRMRYTYSQSIEIFPNGDYDFWMANEVSRILELAKVLSLTASVKSRNNVVVIEVTDYLPIRK